MTRGKLIGMSLLLLLCETLMAIPAIQRVLRDEYSWLGDLAIILACVGGVGFAALLVWYAIAVKRPRPKNPFTIPEASAYLSDPFFEWCRENEALIKQYHNCHLAISPTRGILIVSRTDEEFESALQATELPEDAVLTHASLLAGRPFNTTVH